jgi:hypothetical protein
LLSQYGLLEYAPYADSYRQSGDANLRLMIGGIVGGSLLWASPALAQNRDVDRAITRLERAVADLEERTSGADPNIGTAQVSDLAEKVERLKAASTELSDRAAPKYAATLENNASLLERAAGASSLSEAQSLMSDAGADIDVKLRHHSTVMKFDSSKEFTDLVRVSVRTMRNGNPVPGYLIELSPKVYEKLEALYTFNQLTRVPDGASGIVAPGRYIVSAVLNGVPVVSDKRDIGLLSQSSEILDLEVP